jgi:glutamate 5-kinase
MYPHRIVIKIGTSTLTGENGHIDAAYLVRFAMQVAALKQAGSEVVIVTSGAMVAGLEVLWMPPERTDRIPIGQAAAAVGQPQLIKEYSRAFRPYRFKLAQVLLTAADLTAEGPSALARGTLCKLLELGAIPLINENDSVAVEEIRFGDNDTLAARVATLIDADLMVILSDIDGLYTADPHTDTSARLIETVSEVTPELLASASGAGSFKGSGGMATKLQAAQTLLAAGIDLVICNGRSPRAILSAASGAPIGTSFTTK